MENRFLGMLEQSIRKNWDLPVMTDYGVETIYYKDFAKLPLINNEDDSYKRVYSYSKSSQWYPFYYEHQNYWSYPVLSSYFIDILKGLKDRRLFYYAEPAPKLKYFLSNSFDAYSGVDPTMEYGEIQAEYTAGLHSSLNKRYYKIPNGEPVKFIAYSEVEFILAEAALRGWETPSSAKTHYDNGVKASMLFTAKYTPDKYRHNVVIDEVKTQLPLRFMYPASEYSQNRENVEEAVQRQFGGSDTPNGVMWILK